MAFQIRFLGGAGTVTGSKFLIEHAEGRILLDCGLFQGLKSLRLKNWSPLSVDAKTIDAVILTHAHLDHSGYIPLLHKQGFNGPVYCTAPTRSLAEIILMDSAKIQEEDARRANEGGYTRHQPARALATAEDTESALGLFKRCPLEDWQTFSGNIRFRFLNAGHILGSTIVQIEVGSDRITFSGDLGRSNPLLLHRPADVTETDYLVIESTYGDRVHSDESPFDALEKVINRTINRGGHVLIPAFAVGRTQDLLHIIHKLKTESRIPSVPVYLDSPMGIDASSLFMEYPAWHKVDLEEIRQSCHLPIFVRDFRKSISIQAQEAPSIVLAGSGMVTGGRILSHLEARLPDRRNTVALVGFQALSTRGRLLQDGVPELKIHGRYIPVRAEVATLPMLSAHADQRELVAWAGKMKPKKTFIVHGEPQAAEMLRLKLTDTHGFQCVIPEAEQSFAIN